MCFSKETCCGECYYFVFAGFQKVCAHSNRPKLLDDPPKTCGRFTDIHPCIAAGEPPRWARRLSHKEIFCTLRLKQEHNTICAK